MRDWPRGAYVNTFQSILGSDGDLTLRFATLEDAEALLEKLEAAHDEVDFELYDGGQSVYHYIVSAE